MAASNLVILNGTVVGGVPDDGIRDGTLGSWWDNPNIKLRRGSPDVLEAKEDLYHEIVVTVYNRGEEEMILDGVEVVVCYGNTTTPMPDSKGVVATFHHLEAWADTRIEPKKWVGPRTIPARGTFSPQIGWTPREGDHQSAPPEPPSTPANTWHICLFANCHGRHSISGLPDGKALLDWNSSLPAGVTIDLRNNRYQGQRNKSLVKASGRHTGLGFLVPNRDPVKRTEVSLEAIEIDIDQDPDRSIEGFIKAADVGVSPVIPSPTPITQFGFVTDTGVVDSLNLPLAPAELRNMMFVAEFDLAAPVGAVHLFHITQTDMTTKEVGGLSVIAMKVS